MARLFDHSRASRFQKEQAERLEEIRQAIPGSGDMLSTKTGWAYFLVPAKYADVPMMYSITTGKGNVLRSFSCGDRTENQDIRSHCTVDSLLTYLRRCGVFKAPQETEGSSELREAEAWLRDIANSGPLRKVGSKDELQAIANLMQNAQRRLRQVI